jgi:hypothetical protein
MFSNFENQILVSSAIATSDAMNIPTASANATYLMLFPDHCVFKPVS